MANLFLASSFTDVPECFEQFNHSISYPKTVSFIPTASKTEKVDFYVEAAKYLLQKMGFVIDELDIATASYDEIKHKLETNDFIYVTGGNTFYLLQALKESGADAIITQQIHAGKPYIGESAGSIVLANDISYINEMDDKAAAPTLANTQGLGIIEVYPLPHYRSTPFSEQVETILLDYQLKLDLVPITNTQVIVIKGEYIQVLTEKSAND